MSLAQLVDSYGYSAIIVGSFLEGETVLILGGITAKLGYLQLPWVIVCAFIGSLLGDQLYFFIGRYRGTAFLRKHPNWAPQVDKVNRILQRHRIKIIFGFRFLYGLRTVTPFVIGMSQIPMAEFMILNILGAAIWATGIGMLGYSVGHALDFVLDDLRHYEMEVLGTVLVIGVAVGLLYLLRSGRKGHQER